ncbi:isoprenoid synthase domain-containing protein [Radiomyces spectabilis]|uniref:isoprenoid synthase domain-containing protein n=1 Tax=Radiomyces spectabilis TaxID=64574 RepID=UPI002220F0AD|nr:isoprenoid synthase domain-containing protein [Radiomyces spectabilis]KAI8388373.1 isoprenoid synthase domain-containing protein [Radiomyces spectabilis]
MHSLRVVRSSATRAALRPSLLGVTVAHYHTTRPHYRASESAQDTTSPFAKIAQGINTLRSTILTTTPLRHVTKPAIDTLPFTGTAQSWNDAIREARSLVLNSDNDRIVDPAKLVGKDLWELKGNITKLLGSGHPFLDTIANYLSSDNDHLRPLLVLLVAQATNCATTPASVHPNHNVTAATVDPDMDMDISSKQRRLAEIADMIHTASLLHDDIIDSAEKRRISSATTVFGNKMAVLAGDFLLARASLALAQLRNAECIELMATCIANSVEGEFMQLQNTREESMTDLDYYMETTYNKTGSLIAQSCKSAAVLSGCPTDFTNAAYRYGRNLGIALQLMEDVRVFGEMAANLGKSARTDLQIGLAPAPLLFACEEYPELKPIIQRQFKENGDADKARVLVYQSNGLKKTLALVTQHCDQAVAAIQTLPRSKAQSALIQLASNLPSRS